MKVDIAAVILAAGTSRRMGAVNKLLTDWQGKPMVRNVVETALESGVEETLVVTGHEADKVRQALDGLDVGFVDNPQFAQGLSTSLKAGIDTLGTELAGAAVLLADMPRLQVETLNALMAEFKGAGGDAICLPICGGRRGNPVLWPREFFPEILKLSGDRGAHKLITKFEDRVLEVACEDAGVLMDIDTPGDLNA